MMPKATLYSRAGCHLCEVMREGLGPLLRGRGLLLEVVDVDTDATLRERYGLRIPVFTLDDEVVCEARLDEAAVKDALNIR